MGTLNNRLIQHAGTLDEVWLPWLARQRIARVPIDVLCGGADRLVVIAPHPDDEILACGGLLAMCSAIGMNLLVIALTDGEASHGFIDAEAKSNLALIRIEESSLGLLALGVRPESVLRLHVADGDVVSNVHDISMRIQQVLRPSDLVITTWSLDGHPDHEAASVAAQLACDHLKCRLLQAPVWMWHWATPDHACVPWSNLRALDLPGWAVRAKHKALVCHHSQLKARGDNQPPALIASIVERSMRPQEYYFQ